MDNKNKPIAPVYGADKRLLIDDGINEDYIKQSNAFVGLTKREYFAGLAMQSLIRNQGETTYNLSRNREGLADDIAAAAIRCADELLKQLK